DDLARLARIARLRGYLDDRIRVRLGRAGPEFQSRDEALGAVASWKAASGGWSVDFVDVDVRVNADGTARAFATAELPTREPQTGQQTLDSREVSFSLQNENGEWLVREAESKDPPGGH